MLSAFVVDCGYCLIAQLFLLVLTGLLSVAELHSSHHSMCVSVSSTTAPTHRKSRFVSYEFSPKHSWTQLCRISSSWFSVSKTHVVGIWPQAYKQLWHNDSLKWPRVLAWIIGTHCHEESATKTSRMKIAEPCWTWRDVGYLYRNKKHCF